MNKEQQTHLNELANKLVTPERYGEVQRVAELAVGLTEGLATVSAMYPDLPQAAILYFPDRPGDSVL